MIRMIGANVMGSMVSGVAGLLAIPIYLRMFGEAEYGRFIVVWIVVSYFAVFQLGIGRAIANGIAATDDSAVHRDYRAFGNMCLVTLGGVAAGCFVILHRTVIRVSGGGDLWLSWADIGSVSVVIVLNTMASGWMGILEGAQEFAAINILTSVGAVAIQWTPILWCLVYGRSLQQLVLGSALARMVGPAAYVLFKRRVVEWPTSVSHMKGLAVGVLGFGVWSAVGSTVVPLVASLDKIAIAKWAGVGNVPYYSVPFTLCSRLQVVPNSVARVMFPVLSRDSTRDGLLRNGAMAVAAVFAMVVVVAMWAMRWWLVVWVGAQFARSAYVTSVLLCCGMWVNGIGFIPHVYLEAQRRPDVPTKVVLAAMPLYLAGMVIAARSYGIEGVVVAWLCLQLVVTVALLVVCRLLRIVDIVGTGALAACLVATMVAEVWSGGPDFIMVVTTVIVAGTILVLIARQYPDRIRRAIGALMER